MAKFFKSTWFKCTAVLLTIALVSGGLLALLNDLLYVSAEERTGRAFQKIYGRAYDSSEYTTIVDVDSDNIQVNQPVVCEGFGQIEKIYLVGDVNSKHDVLFKTTGNEGYKGGTVTMWIKVVVDGSSLTIDKVLIDGNTKQTLMSKLGESFTNGFFIDISQNYDTYFTANDKEDGIKNPVSGATYSAQAGCNAVNCVLKYLRGQI